MSAMTADLAPGLLLASPPLGDPNFDRTVVLLALHGAEGALGFVVNRIAPMKLGELLSFAGYGDQGDGDESPVYLGGPVQPSSGWILVDDPTIDAGDEGIIVVGERIRVTSSRRAFDEVAKHAGPGASSRDLARRLVLLGYSGWGPGQLENEIASGAWMPAPLDEDVLFKVEAEQRWERAYERLGLSPVKMMSMRTVGEA
jgi:putative transcriptional regulator